MIHPSSHEQHSDNFAFLRTAAALLVLFAHQHALTGRPEPSFIGIHSYGGLGVMIFFAISGFLITLSWARDPNVGRFAMRRLLRIWPGYAVAILLAVGVLGPIVSQLAVADYFRHPAAADYLRNLFFQMRGAIPAEFTGSAIPFAVNGSLWTIPLELQCYALFCVLGVLGLVARRGYVLASLLFVALYYAGWQVRGESLVQGLHLSIERQYLIEFGVCFFSGVLLRLYWTVVDARLTAFVLGSVALGCVAFAAGRPVLAGLVGVPIVAIAFGSRSWKVVNRFDRLGDLSYGIYLYAFPVQQTIIHFLGDRLHWWPRLMVTVLVTVMLAYISWHVVEKRAMRLKPRRHQDRAYERTVATQG